MSRGYRLPASALALALALGAAGCGKRQPDTLDAALEASRKPQATEHDAARFLVDYGGSQYRVNVRYVELIDESVIAVRQGSGEALEEAWPRLTLTAAEGYSRVQNFADDQIETYIVDIAKGVQAHGGICEDGQALAMATNADGDVRTTFRRNRQVWVVFALCPEQVPQ
ncbi:MAG: hypothetical protein AAF675_02840 [Pseudomonadota bacterium]